MIRIPLFLLLCSFFTASPRRACCQQQRVMEGKVIDAETKHPLPFVNIRMDTLSSGTVSDMDGLFRIHIPQGIHRLYCSYVGYLPETLRIPVQNPLPPVLISMQSTSYSLHEFTVKPGVNPAHRIIRQAVENKPRNNPENLHAFSYTSYNKMVFTADYDSMYFRDENKRKGLDSSDQKAVDFLGRHHLMLMEFISKREYLSPGMNHEKVIASRISGLKNPAFALLATQMQSFSFYPDYISIYDKDYLNPLSKGSFSKYLFILEDTIFNGSDTVFIISFRPKRGRTFNAMQGLLYINTNGYAIQNVISEPVYQRDEGISVKIRQEYKQTDGTHWFPVKLNTNITYGMLEISEGHKVVGIGRSYLGDIRINPPLRKKDFEDTALEIEADAGRKDSLFWNRYRPLRLDQRERRTYHYIDSIGREVKLDKKLNALSSLMENRLPVWRVDIDLDKLLDYNAYEGFRLGMGLHSGKRISKRFSAGAYWAYGTRDRKMKYGGDCMLHLWKKRHMSFRAYYGHDVMESGGTRFYQETQSLFSSASYHDFVISNMDDMLSEGFSLRFLSFRYLSVDAGGSVQLRKSTNDYLYNRLQANNITYSENTFHITEGALRMRYAYKEQYGEFGDARFSLGTRYPVVWLNLHKGFAPLLGGRYAYVKTELKIRKEWLSRTAGRFSTQLTAGMTTGDMPYTLLYNGRGNATPYGIFSEGSFETMGVNEFLSDRYIAFSWLHHLFYLPFRGKRFRPELIMVNNVMAGSLSHKESHQGMAFKTLEKGYFETGLLLNDLFMLNFSGFGLGAFYRYGSYAYPQIRKNISIKLSLDFNI